LIYLSAGVFVFALTVPSQAQQIDVGTGLLCDSREEVEQYLALTHEGDSAEAVVAKINHDAGQTACAMLTVAFIRAEDIKTVPFNKGFGAIAKVAVVGVYTGTDWQPLPLVEQFMIVSLEEREA
jgi:hypothetical protein